MLWYRCSGIITIGLLLVFSYTVSQQFSEQWPFKAVTAVL